MEIAEGPQMVHQSNYLAVQWIPSNMKSVFRFILGLGARRSKRKEKNGTNCNNLAVLCRDARCPTSYPPALGSLPQTSPIIQLGIRLFSTAHTAVELRARGPRGAMLQQKHKHPVTPAHWVAGDSSDLVPCDRFH